MARMLLMCGVAALLVAGCSARSAGAPDSVCNDPDMVPTTHVSTFSATGVRNANQYTLTAKPEPNRPGVIRVTLSGPEFKGFVVRATTSKEENLGEFLVDPEATSFKPMTCASQEHVAVTHTEPSAKSSVTLFWRDGNNGNNVFQATVVPDLSTFITHIFEQ